ncbi:N-6 DNA methylase [Candidatus Parcubacteria bacterium]|nr:N-6 DNA methylase [Candidatus Parcubacteria bacterium]
MNKHEAKEKISELVKKYQRIAEAGKIKSFNEAQTRMEFIEPLFGFLGWDMRNTNNDNEVTTEETISRGRVDLAFRINGIPKFFLEAKSLKADLDIESYARQAINYSWNKGVNWAVLTDFEGIKIFNANAKSKSLRDKMVFEISYDEYIQDFERLWLLSRESFEKNALDVYAERHGKKSKSLTVNEKLFGDLKQAREILTKSFNNWKEHWDKNKNIDQETLDEGVQRIIDRLVFIRVLEDKKLEPPILKPIIREWEKDRSNNKQLFQMLTEKFRELDDIYNSSLFTKHACEDWEEYDEATKKAIELLYGNDVYEYNFKEIPADILGGVYESYLGYIAQKPIETETKKKSGKLSKAKDKKDLKIKSRKKRKEQGIYYTPNFIVDYIIKNTLGKKLEEIKNVNDLKQIKILDPACGSGSFLIKALETVNEKYKDFNNPGDQYTKSGILLGNIYGVDLDPQAVELAKLNLLINALDQKAKLPNLTDNIRVGNSLISGTEKELKKYFGKNWRDKKPFNWEEEFPFCHSRENGNPESGFDVIIGNPPYIKEFINKNVFDGLHNSPYYQGKMDIWTMFACVSIDLLKENGILGFIAPNNWVSNVGASILRDKILREGELKTFIDFGDYKIFEQAGIQTMIFIFEKKKPNKKYVVDYLKITDKDITEDTLINNIFSKKIKINIEPKKLIGDNITFAESKLDLILDKIKKKKNFELLDKEVGQGIVAAPDKYFLEKSIESYNKKERNFLKEFYTASGRYKSGESQNYIFYICDKNFGDKKIKDYSNIEKHFKPFQKDLKDAKVKYGTPNKPYFYLHRERNEEFFSEGPKIICGVRTAKPSFFYTKKRYYGSRALNFIKTDRINLKYLTGILNSKMSFFWLKKRGKQLGDLLQIDKGPLLGIPIYVGDKKQQKVIIELVDKILNLNKQLQSTPENSDKWNTVKKEVGKVDGEIDERVFELYGLEEKEIGIIKNFNEK